MEGTASAAWSFRCRFVLNKSWKDHRTEIVKLLAFSGRREDGAVYVATTGPREEVSAMLCARLPAGTRCFP